jgi:transcription termination/antitermination protein NusG
MEKEWFVLHTLTGKEGQVKASIAKRLELEGMEDLIGEVAIPSEKVSEVKRGKKTTSRRIFYPGYVLINICLYKDDRTINEKVWYFINNTTGVVGFVGGKKPVPLKTEEVERIMHQIEEKKEKITPKVQFTPGETVKVNEGPFLNFNGVITEIDPDRGKLKISVSIFGRTAPVELEYWQVERV